MSDKVLIQADLEKPWPLKVHTFLSNGTETEKVIDFHNPADRKWLSTHCWWAIHNGHSVLTHTN